MKIRTILKYVMIPVGAVGGYLYYAYVGCASGACVMSSDATMMTIYGGVLGYFIGGVFTPMKKQTEGEEG